MASNAETKEELKKTDNPEEDNEEENDDTDDDDDDDDSDSDDNSEEEEVEPKLKYERIANSLSDILSKDAASCMAVHPKFLALGTHWGMIHILDHGGNNIRDKEITAHTTTVNQISIDSNGDYMASCSDDGRVIITGLYASDHNQTVTFDRPVKAIALDPVYYKQGSGSRYVTGEDKLIINERSGFLGRHKMNVVHQGEGAIRNIKWGGDFIAWASDRGVKVYDTEFKAKISKIDKDHDYRPELHICQLVWRDNRTLLIGWGDRVKICVVKNYPKSETREGVPNRFVEITSIFQTDFFICGIAPLATNVVVLTYDKADETYEGGRLVAPRPHLQLLEPHLKDCAELSNDALSIRGFQEYRCNDYHLECIPEENLFYIVSPKDIVVARLRDLDDHLSWLVDHDMYEEAMAAATEHARELRRHTYHDIGRAYITYLIESESFEEAGKLCVKVLGRRKELWEEQIKTFSKINQLQAIATYIPREDPQLSHDTYEAVLRYFLENDPQTFYSLVKEWPGHVYNTQTIIDAILTKLDSSMNVGGQLYLQALGQLYAHQKAYDKALGIYLRLKHTDVFSLIRTHSLYHKLHDRIPQLMDLDHTQTTALLMEHTDSIPSQMVVSQLQSQPYFLYVYLDKLVSRDLQSTHPHHGALVKLYAEYDRPKLLTFLKRSEFYPLQAAWEECEARDYTKEQVYLLGRMGNLTQALRLIMERLGDVEHAIQFCMDHCDEELWDSLIDYAMVKPQFITKLLHSVGAHVDPVKVITRIQPGMEIPQLRDSLVKILQDYNLQLSLRDGCRKILVADSFNLMDRLVKTQKKGVFVDGSQLCSICNQKLLVNDLRYASNLVVFHCRHAFHEDCLPSYVTNCPICSSVKKDRRPGSREHYLK